MIETHTSISKRILAGLFAMLMVLTLVPNTAIKASAADTYPNSYTVTVTDGTGDIVKGAVVKITSNTVGVELDLTVTTDGNGVAAFDSSAIAEAMASLDGSTAEVKITVTTKEDYKAFETEAVIVKNNTSANVNITLLKEITDDFTISDQNLPYTGEAQELVDISNIDTRKYDVSYYYNDETTTEMPEGTAAGEYNVKVIIAKKTEDGTAIDEDYEKIEKIVSTTISVQPTFSVTVTPVADFPYDGVKHQLVTLGDDLQDGDVVSFECDNNNATVIDGKIYATNAGTYSVKVKVERVNFTPFETTVEVEIKKAQLDTNNIIVTCATGLKYNGEDQQLITNVTGLEGIDKTDINWYIDSSNEAIQGYENVKGKAVGTYEIYLEVETDNYKAVSKYKVGEVKIDACAVDNAIIENLRIETADLSYKEGKQQELIESVSEIDGYTIWFILEDDIDVKPDVNASGWTDNSSDIKGELAGEYYIYVKIVKDNDNNYAPTRVEKENYFPVKAEIKRAEQTPLVFNDSSLTEEGETTVVYSQYSENIIAITVKESELGDVTSGADVVYKIESCVDGDNIDDIASISNIENTKYLEYRNAGIIKVTATRPGGNNYEDVTIERFINITKNSDITFSEPSKDCVLNVKGTVLSDQAATKAESKDNGTITYSFEDEGNAQKEYLTIDSDGNVTINNVVELASEIETAGGKLSVTIIADKAAGTKRNKYTGKDVGVYLADSTTYTLNISFETTPTTPYTLAPATPNGADNWFTSAVKVNAPTGYEIAKEVNGSFDSDVEFGDGDDTVERYVYLKKDDGGITNKIAVKYNNDNLKIDTKAPTDIKIEYSKSITDKILETVTLGFYNPSVTIKFTAEDATSGVKEFNWTYTNAKYASTSITPTKTSGTETAQKNNDGTYSATLTLTADEFNKANQYRGYIAVTATDNASNVSDTVKDDGKVFVVDRIAPELEISYTAPTVTTDGTDFYGEDNSAVEFKLKATEANFYPEDVKITIKKDGKSYTVPNGTTWTTTTVKDENGKDKITDESNGTFTLTEDGDYVITITYKDKSINDANIINGEDCNGEITTSTDENGVKTTTYTKSFTIDQTAPKIKSVVYRNEDVKSTKDGRDYYDATQTATVTILEHNFDADKVKFNVTATDANGNDVDVDIKQSDWKVDDTNKDKNIVTLTFEADANYTFDIECVDKATNAIEDYTANEFTVDKTAPNEDSLKVTYIESKTGKVAEVLSLGYFQNKVKVIITAEDATAGVNAFTYGYRNAKGVSQVNGQLLDQKLKEADVKIEGNKTTATFTIPKSALGKGTQFNGNVEFIAIDRSGNETAKTDENRIIVDNIAPVANVTFSDPVNTVGDISYYAGDINATITINEANFNAKDYKVVLTKDGVVDNISTDVKWTDESVDVHKGTFTIKADGDYVVELSGADKSGNKLKNYTSKQLTIDTDIKEPTFSINGAAKSGIGGAYKGDISVSFNYEDENFDNAEIKLVKTSLNSVEDVTSKYINANNEEKGGSGSFSIPAEVANDGIYTLTVNMNDKAKHTSSAELKFTVNRYGSVYEYSDYLISLIKDGGQYVTIKDGATAAITEDIVITEYNATPILSDSLKVLITRDGEVIEADYTTTPSNLDSATIGNSGWYQYVYTIKASNFAEDGVYKISLVSQYSANDAENNESTSVPENSIDSEGNEIVDTMTFTVDTKAPEIRNITNLEKSYIDADSVEVNYSIVDVGGLKSIEVIVNGKAVAEITDFKENLFSYDGSFTLKADTKEQTVQIIVTDLAGNVTDTSSEAFDTQGLYTFNPNVTVSTNIFVLWYANTPLFWGSIGGGVGVIGAAAVGVPKLRVRLRKRK